MKDPALLPIPEEHVLTAFAAMMLGSSPLEPSPEASSIVAMAARLAEPRGARRPGDVEATRAFRSVYALAREHAPVQRDDARADRIVATKAWIMLGATLALRRRQRAALVLRYVFGLPAPAVARVLGLSRSRTADVARAGALRVSHASGGRVDVGRHLRTIGRMLQENGRARPAQDRPREPRSVVKLLLSNVSEDAATPVRIGASSPPSAPSPPTAPRPVYGRPLAGLRAPAPPVPRSAPRPRIRLLLAACIAALAFVGAFAPSMLLGPSSRAPLAVVPFTGAVEDVTHGAGPAAITLPIYDVRAGDTLWSIARVALGDAARWREVWSSNAGSLMTDGTRFTDPDLIRPGWRLKLPTR